MQCKYIVNHLQTPPSWWTILNIKFLTYVISCQKQTDVVVFYLSVSYFQFLFPLAGAAPHFEKCYEPAYDQFW